MVTLDKRLTDLRSLVRETAVKKATLTFCMTMIFFLGNSSLVRSEGIWLAIKENPKCFVWNQPAEHTNEPSQTASWNGTCLNRKVHGKGTFIWRFEKNVLREEQIFVGEFKEGRKTGLGTLTWASGDKYVGEFKEGKRTGQGSYSWAIGDKYVGGYQDDKKHGQGSFAWANGDKYVGGWEDDKKEGQGVLSWADGDKYSGSWEDDKRDGTGTYKWANGDMYVGGWKDDKRHGKGIGTWANGNRYVGEFKKGREAGPGTLTWANGDKYVGEFKDGKRTGQGSYSRAIGDKYVDGSQDDIVILAQMPINAKRSSALVTHVVTASEIENAKATDLTEYLSLYTPSVSINSAQNNPLQPDLQYRGFSASPLLGLSQGLVVYQNGARVNEPLGDSVNWDLVPDSAIERASLLAGGNPLFGLNALGGALSLTLKNGFTYEEREAEIRGGSWGRFSNTLQIGGNDGRWGYYGNISFFQEDGWRELSDSEAVNLYVSGSYRGAESEVDLGLYYADTKLIGNGASPRGLLNLSRKAIFTAPDITENNMKMVTVESKKDFGDNFTSSSNIFYRDVSSLSFNGDSSDLSLCDLAAGPKLIDGFDENKLESLGLDEDDVCENNSLDVSTVNQLEDILNLKSSSKKLQFDLEDVTNKIYAGTSLSDEAINNTSSRDQKSYGADIQGLYREPFYSFENSLFVGVGYQRGTSKFDSQTELATLDPTTRSTWGLGLGTFLSEEKTRVSTSTSTWSAYFLNTLNVKEELAISLGGRYNRTRVSLKDRTGVHPEIEGRHLFRRFNPTISAVLNVTKHNDLYITYGESSRAPTPIELACNDQVFTIARAAAEARGEDPDDIDLECRLPNAFLADPPLEQVVAESIEFGTRGSLDFVDYQLSFFRTNNKNDIIFQTTGRGKGLFSNVDNTRREGIETSLKGNIRKFSWVVSYSFIKATFEDDFRVLSPNHPLANADGDIFVQKGDSIPGIPEHQFKFTSDIDVTDKLNAGIEFSLFSDQFLRGDESNDLPTIGGYAVTNIKVNYSFSRKLDFFVRVANIFDRDYENFGLIGESPEEVLPDLEDNSPRFLGSGSPRAAWVGISLLF